MSNAIGKKVKLNNDTFIPFMGLGTWEIRNADEVVKEALNVGYRCIDTAVLYNNEKLCGKGIIDWLKENPSHKREEIYYITKLWNNQNGYDKAKSSILECFEKVKELGYIDLLLIHSPTEGSQMRLETWKAMQEAVEQGIVKSIGVSNYGIKHLQELLSWDGLKIKPVVNEIEVSPWCMRQALCDFTKSQGIDVIAYAPLSHSYRIKDEDAVEIANKKGVSVAQVLIRWSLQKGYIPIPKTKTFERLPINLDVLGFELTEYEMKQLDHPNVHDPSDWEVTTCP
jgi:diketogulonate reductase-like aldo/keto reductase